MSDLLDENEGLEPSADPILDESEVTTDEGVAEATEADSSPATGEDEGSDSLLSVVRDVVSKDQEASAPPAESEKTDQEPEAEAAGEQDNETYKDVPFNQHPRFQQLIRERNSLRDGAAEYQKIQTFLDESGLSSNEAANGLQIMALMKTDPTRAWEMLKPTVQNLLVAAGEVLPDDLKERVSKGELSQEAALEVSRARAASNYVQVRQDFAEQRQQRHEASNRAKAVQDAASTWEADRQRKDPNFAEKYEPLMDQVYRLQRAEGVPSDPAGVRDQLNRAYAEVNKRLGAAAPAASGRAPAKPAAPAARPANASGQVAGNAQPKARSTLDIIKSFQPA